MAEEVPSGTPPQAPPDNVQGDRTSPRTEETTQSAQDASRQDDRNQEDKGLLDEIKDAILREEERGREEPIDLAADRRPFTETSERALKVSRGRDIPPPLPHFRLLPKMP